MTVSVKGTTIGTTADATGHYYLKNLPEGPCTIVAEAIGYSTVEQQVVMKRNKTVELNFVMQEQTLAMDEVVVSATRNVTNKRSSAVIVNVASAKLFDRTASTDLAETMKFQSGLRIENNCGNCGTTQLRINGLEGQYSQILLDSNPIFSSLAAVYGLEQLPTAMIERVEVIRGGGSALFGSSAIGGVVNIITKEPLRNSLTLSNITDILKGGTAEYNTSLNGSFVSDDRRAGVYLFGMIKNRNAYDRNGDGYSDIPRLQSETAGFRGYYKTSAYTKLTAEYHHIHEFRRGGDSIDLAPHMTNIAEQLDHRIDGGSLRFDGFSADSRHRYGVGISAQGIKRNSYYGTDKNPDTYGHTTDLTLVASAQYTYAFERCLFMPAQLTAGAEYTYNDLSDDFPAVGRHMVQTVQSGGVYVQNEWQNERFNIIVGGRLDAHNMVDKPIFSPRANIRYSPHRDIGLRLSYSSGYRAPQAYNEDLHIDVLNRQAAIIRIDPNLKPEHSHSVSASADLYHCFGRVETNLLIKGFYTDLNDVFALSKVGEDEAGNIIKLRHQRLGRNRQGHNRRVQDRHGRYIRTSGWLHLPAQPLRRARKVVGRCGTAAAHVPLPRQLWIPYGRLRPYAASDGLALRELYGAHARTAQCRIHRTRHRTSDTLVLGHGPAHGIRLPTDRLHRHGAQRRCQEPVRQLPAGSRLRPREGFGLHLRPHAAAYLLRRVEVYALTSSYPHNKGSLFRKAAFVIYMSIIAFQAPPPRCSTSTLTPMAIRIMPPHRSALMRRAYRPPNFMPKRSPAIVTANDTNPMTQSGYTRSDASFIPIHTNDMPTASASMLVASAMVNMTFVSSGLKCLFSSLPNDSITMRPPRKSRMANAIQWSTLSIRWRK